MNIHIKQNKFLDAQGTYHSMYNKMEIFYLRNEKGVMKIFFKLLIFSLSIFLKISKILHILFEKKKQRYLLLLKIQIFDIIFSFPIHFKYILEKK